MLDALRLGTHQLLSMRVPAHAAISTTVDLVRHRVGAGAAGFANAVLRKVAGPRPRRVGRAGRPRPGDLAGRARRRRAQPPPLGGRGAPRRPGGSRRRRRRAGRPAGRRQRAAPGHPGGPARSGHPRRAAGRADARTRRTAWCWTAATRARYRPWPRAGPACRTRAPSWSRWRWPRRRWTAPTRPGSTSARGRAARRRCWPPWPGSVARGWWRTSGSPTAPAWSRVPWAAPTACSGS